MNKYLLPIIAAGAIASVSYAQTIAPIALELWDFEDAAGLSLKGQPTVDSPNPTGVANSGSNDSAWNFGGFSNGASTDGIGNLVVTGKSGQVYRQTVPVSSPPTTGKYRLTLDISSWNMSVGQMVFDLVDSAGGRVAGYALSTTEANGTRLQALVRSASSQYGGNQYFSVNLADNSATPISAYIEFDLDNDTAEVVVDGNTLGSAVTDLDSLDLSSIKFNQNGQFVDTNVVKIASMGLYEIIDTTTDTDGDGIADYYETGTGIWVSVTNTGTDPAVADATVQGIDIALYNYIASLGSGSGSGGSAGPEGPQGPAGPAGPPGPAGADGLDSDAIQNLRSSAHIERSATDPSFNVNYSIESSSDLENWNSEVSNSVSVDPTSSAKMFLRLSTN
jgi:hypothetical protein